MGWADFGSGWEVALVLGGGNALGAYHWGVCEALWEAGLRPDRVVGASIGAVTGALLLGGPPEGALGRVAAFWEAAALPDGPFAGWMPGAWRARWSEAAGLGALLGGRPGLTRPRLPGLWSLLPFAPPDPAVQDHTGVAALLDRLVDWDRLHASAVPLHLLAVDFRTGEEVWWQSGRDRIGARHLLAATALAPLFPPVAIDGRSFCDGGLADNLPVDEALAAARGPVLVVASDCYAPGGGPEPRDLDGVLSRVQDLAFGIQARRGIEAAGRERALLRRLDPELPPAVLGWLRFKAPPHQRALRGLDFTRSALAERRAQGGADAGALLGRLPEAPRDEALAVVEAAARPAGQ